MARDFLIGIVVLIIVVVGGYFLLTSDRGMEQEEVVVSEREVLVTLKNVSEDQILSPGVLVLHDDRFSLNYVGDFSPKELEPLAEYGSQAEYLIYVQGQEGVMQVIDSDLPILPGGEVSFSFVVPEDGTSHLSASMMLVNTNDGLAVVDTLHLFSSDGLNVATVGAINYDNGTEENEAPNGGFEAGQPDPERGEENIENGVATDPPVEFRPHDQIVDTVLELSIEPVMVESDQ